MAKSTNLLLQNVSGHLGKQFVVKQYGNKTVLAAYPETLKKRKRTPKQKVVTNMMEEANDYALDTIADTVTRDAAQVRLNVLRNKLYTALVSEFFKNARESKQ